jgi:hypothetical protein
VASAVPNPKKKSAGTVWNIKLPDGRVLSKIIGEERPTIENGGLKDRQRVSSGPYPDLKTAITRERSDLFYAHLLRRAMHQGVFLPSSGHFQPTLEQIAEWTGINLWSLQAWLKPLTSRSHRPMPRWAIRLIVHEIWLLDQSTYEWEAMLKKCR